MVHPHTELRFVSPVIGWGVFATRPLPKGTITWALDAIDRRFEHAEIEAMPRYARELLHRYCYVDARGRRILCWDHARFFNHSCEANCLSVGYEFEMAIRDIAEGEELTDDYGTLNPEEPFPCLCGSPGCRKVILPDDHVRLGEDWNARARAAFFLLKSVDQPLWEVLTEQPAIEAALADPNRLRPIQSHFPGPGREKAAAIALRRPGGLEA